MRINVSSLFSCIQGRVICVVPFSFAWLARLEVSVAVLSLVMGVFTGAALAGSARHSNGHPPRQSNSPSASSGQQTHPLAVKVLDENGVVVVSARIIITQTGNQSGSRTVVTGETDYTGRHEFSALKP